MDSEGNTFGYHETSDTTVEDCKTMCKRTINCIGLDWVITGTCYLLSSYGDTLSPPTGEDDWLYVDLEYDGEAPITTADAAIFDWVCHKLVAGMLQIFCTDVNANSTVRLKYFELIYVNISYVNI